VHCAVTQHDTNNATMNEMISVIDRLMLAPPQIMLLQMENLCFSVQIQAIIWGEMQHSTSTYR